MKIKVSVREAGRGLTLGSGSGPGLGRGLVLVIVGVLHLLAAVGQVAQDAHAVLHALVIVGGALDGRLDDGE